MLKEKFIGEAKSYPARRDYNPDFAVDTQIMSKNLVFSQPSIFLEAV